MKKALLWALLVFLPVSAQTPSVQVQRLAASFISNFPAYVQWPEGSSPTLRIGFIGPSPLGQAGLAYLDQRGRFSLEILPPGAYTASDLSQYQMLIFGLLPDEELKPLLKLVKKKPVLTIGFSENFISLGGIIEMHIRGNAVTWDVDMKAGKEAGLLIDHRLITYGKSM